MSVLINATRSHRRRRAFTLTELQVVIGVIGVLNALLYSGIIDAAFSARGRNVQFVGHGACLYINTFDLSAGRYPDDLQEFREFLLFNNELTDGDWVVADGDSDMLIERGRMRMQYAQEEAEIALHLEFLRAIDDDADDFISQVMDRPLPGPLLILSTVEPLRRDHNRYARIWVYFDVMQCGAGQDQGRYVALENAWAPVPVDPIDTAALQSVAVMLQSDSNSRERAREIPSILREPETVQFVHAVFDRNSNGAITLGEFSQKSRQLADQPVDDDSTVGQRVTKQFFGVVVNELALTADDDSSSEILFSVGDVTEDPTELFSYQKLCDHTSLYVVDDGVEDKLCRRLRLAQFLEEKDLLRARDNVLTAEQRFLQRLSGKELLPEAAGELEILTEVRKGFGR